LRLELVLVALLTMPVAASAEVDLDGAHRHFTDGRRLYQEARYEEALREMEVAYAAALLPEIEYDIGLCLEKLGRHAAAADTLEHYLADAPSDPQSAEIRLLVRALRAGRTRSPAPRRAAAIALGAIAGGFLAVSLTTGSVVLADRADAGNYDRNRALAITTDVLWSIGAAAGLSAIILAATQHRKSGAPR
jgi:hypothetical protein